MSFDLNKLMQQAAQMQEQMQRMQEDAKKETAEASVGGGMVKVTANGAGEVLSVEIARDAIDPDDPEGLADLVLAGVNEALRSARAAVEDKAQQMIGELGLGDLGLPGLGGLRGLRGRYVVSNWVWLLIVLVLIGVVVWGWAWDFSR